jgi:predicted ribosomally synthesized peptide with nif11-like leader
VIQNEEEYLMSIDSAKAFFERMKTDEDFRKKVTECKDNEARKAFAKKEGFDFSVEQLKAVTGELSEDALNSVVGGKWCDYHCIPANGI